MRLKWDKTERGTVLNDPVCNGPENSINKSETKEKRNQKTDKAENDNQESWEVQKKNEKLKKKSSLTIYTGVFYSSLSSVFFSLCSVIVKYLKVPVFYIYLILYNLNSINYNYYIYIYYITITVVDSLKNHSSLYNELKIN